MTDLDRHLLAPARLKLATMLTAVSEAEFALSPTGRKVLRHHVAALREIIVDVD